MIYSLDIATSKSTAYADRDTKPLHVTKGLVYKVEIFFPPGSHGLLHCFIMDGGYQCWPSNPGQTFTGDDILISFDDIYIKNSAPFIFNVNTFNLDDTYDHALSIRIGLVSADIFMARFLPTIAFDILHKRLSEIEQEQREEQERLFKEIIEQPFSWMT